MNQPAVILVVDDEKQNLTLMERRLAPLGYDVHFAFDGQDALDQVDRIRPDIVLLDLRMPKIDGFEVARRLKADERHQDIPIVIVSAYNEEKSRIQALEIGVDDFLFKPVSKTELIARIRSLLKIKAYRDHLKEHRKKLEAEVTERTRQLERANERIQSGALETIYRLTHAAEYKDEDTGQHIQRMTNYAVAVGKALGLQENILESIRYAAPLHDIGKIGIPDSILLKPGKLDAAEWEVMKQHSLIGAKILEGSSIGYLKLGKIIALTHHEKWDGNGYPKGLKGKAIPRLGQIVAIADVFDALTSKRPYKEPFSVQKAMGIIEESKNAHFDPEVVEAFFESKEEIMSIQQRYRDDRDSRFLQMIAQTMTPTPQPESADEKRSTQA